MVQEAIQSTRHLRADSQLCVSPMIGHLSGPEPLTFAMSDFLGASPMILDGTKKTTCGLSRWFCSCRGSVLLGFLYLYMNKQTNFEHRFKNLDVKLFSITITFLCDKNRYLQKFVSAVFFSLVHFLPRCYTFPRALFFVFTALARVFVYFPQNFLFVFFVLS